MIVPCYNHASTLHWALASLVAQTHREWECFVVDDGSRDDPEAVVTAFGDPRIEFLRLPANSGPSIARQSGMNQASGRFIAFLDADDWQYPSRLESQLSRFRSVPDLAAVGTGMAIIDGENRLLGLRGCEARRGTGTAASPLPASCGRATVMLRTEVARGGHFDPALRQGEDGNFLARVLPGRAYEVIGDPLYVYRQEPAGTAERSLRAHSLRRQQLRGGSARIPLRNRFQILESHFKSVTYGTADLLGLDRFVAARRNRGSSATQQRDFEEARRTVAAVADEPR